MVTADQEQGAVTGMTKDEAAALGREVSATAGFRGHLQRLAGGSPDGPSWALRVASVLTGGGGLVRSREAWERYHERAQREVRAMVDAKSRDGTLWGAPSEAGRVAGAVVAGSSTGLEVTMSAEGPTVVPDFLGDPAGQRAAPAGPPQVAQGAPGDQSPRRAPEAPRGERHDLSDWRAYTLEAIAQAERDAARLTRQAAEKQAQATRRRRQARELRRALGVVQDVDGDAPAAAPSGGAPAGRRSRGRVLAWAQAHDGELVVAACAQDLGLSGEQVSDAASQASREGRLERVGQGRYQVAGSAPGAGAEVGPPGRGTLEPQEG